jgi:hypothetical protein
MTSFVSHIVENTHIRVCVGIVCAYVCALLTSDYKMYLEQYARMQYEGTHVCNMRTHTYVT